jgi:outer membrane receptor for ferrienterochelin and colicin
VNPEFPFWTAPTAVPPDFRGPLQNAVRDILLANPATRIAGQGLTRQENGNTAVVVSYANAGNAEQYGVDVATGLQATDQLRFDLTGSWFDYDVKDIATGDRLLANTPEWRANAAASFGARNLDLGLNYRYSSGFPWAAGVFVGEVEPGHTFDANAGYRISPAFRVFLAGTNLVNRQWFSIYGGSVNGRRVMGGVTATF